MKIQEIFKWSSASFALVPGLLVISTNLGTFPGISKTLYGGIIEAAGGLTLLLLYFNRSRLQKITVQKLNRISILMFIFFLLSLLSYIILYNSQVVYSNTYDETFFFPFWYGDDLQMMIDNAHSKFNAIEQYGAQAIRDGINNSGVYPELTLVAFIILYLMIFESLVIGFGLLAQKNSDQF